MKTIKVTSLREIDKLVAEHIFDYTNCYLVNIEGTINAVSRDISSNKILNIIQIPYYSTNIKEAWSLIDNFSYFNLEKREKSDWEVWWTPKRDVTYITTASTAELAICMAALKTKGIEVELTL